MRSGSPPIILVVLDTVGAKHLSLYGYSRATSPRLERIARECRLYLRCVAPAGWTVPSHASLFTGLYPSQHGAYEGRFVPYEGVPHLVPLLKASGYRTYGISTNALVSPASGLCPGFDEFHDLGGKDYGRILGGLSGEPGAAARISGDLRCRLRAVTSGREALRELGAFLWETGRIGEALGSVWRLGRRAAAGWLKPGPLDDATPYTRKTLRLVKDILRRQAARPREPFFLFVNLLQAHQKYCPPRRFRRFSRWWHRARLNPQRFYFVRPSAQLREALATYAALYDDEIFYLDHVLGELWDFLKQTPFFSESLIIITSDHGEHLGEKGHYTHILSLYQELLWVPLLVRFPEGVLGPGPDDRLVSLTDLYATILDLLDSPVPRPETSLSLLGPPRREYAVSQCVGPEMWDPYIAARQRWAREQGEDFSPPVFSVITSRGVKIIENRDGGLEVYDLGPDWLETQDLSPWLPKPVLQQYRDLLRDLKVDTDFPLGEAAMGAVAGEKAG